MLNFSSHRLRSLAFLLGLCLLFAGLAGPGRADEIDDLRAEIEKLKQQVLYLQNQMPRSGSGGGSFAAQQQVQFQEIQQQIATLTGRIESVELRLNDVEGKLNRLQEDFDLRLTQLEQGGGAPMAAAGAPPAPSDASGVVSEAPADAGTPPTTPAAPASGGVLGTLTDAQLQTLPQPPEGAAAAAADAAASQSSPEAYYNRATGLMQKKQWAEAEAAWKDFLARFPTHSRAGNAQYWLGETYFVRSDFKRAQIAFAEGYQKYPKSSKAPDNLLKLGISLGKNGRDRDACTAFRQLAKQFPEAAPEIKEKAKRYRELYKCG